MQSIPPFNLPGPMYRGNLHTHTTNSDGRFSPEENVAWHTQHGYDFLTITEPQPGHPFSNRMGPGLIIPGVEISTRTQETGLNTTSSPSACGKCPFPTWAIRRRRSTRLTALAGCAYRSPLLA